MNYPKVLPKPTTQASNIVASDVRDVRMELACTRGSGVKTMLVVKLGSSNLTLPSEHTTYSSGSVTKTAVFGAGTDLGGGNYCVYVGDDPSEVIVTGLTHTTTYTILAYDLNVKEPGSERYNVDSCTLTQATSTPLPYNLLRFNLRYNPNQVGFSGYITSSSFAFAPTIAAAAQVISLTNIAPDGTGNANAVAGAWYDPVNDRIGVHEIDGVITSVFPAENMTQAARLSTIAASRQGISFNPITLHQYVYNPAGSMTVMDLSGNVITTYSAPPHTTDVILHYDYGLGCWWAFREGAIAVAVEKWTLSGSTISIAETKWYVGNDGGTTSYCFGGLTNFDGSAGAARARYQSLDGLKNLLIGANPFSFVTEGIVEYPDGTLGSPLPMGYNQHGSHPNGNTWLRYDPKSCYLKDNKSPSMVPFSAWSGGSVIGSYYASVMNQQVGNKIYSAVYDTNGFTNTENASAWTFEFSDGGDADITFVGSNTAPTGSPTTPKFSTCPYYAGWGATTPSAEQGTPGTFRYKQAVLTVKHKTDIITPADIVAQLGSKCKVLIISHDGEMNYVYPDSTSPTFQIPVSPNQANAANPMYNTTSSQRRSYVSANQESTGTSTASHSLLTTISALTPATKFQITVIGNRVVSTTRAIYWAASIHNTNTWRIICGHKSSSDSPANHVFIEWWNASGFNSRVSFLDATTSPAKYDFKASGSAWSIAKNDVDQSLTVTGSNTGQSFSSLTGTTRMTTGFCLGSTGVSGRHDDYLLIVCDDLQTAEDIALINAYRTQEGLP